MHYKRKGLRALTIQKVEDKLSLSRSTIHKLIRESDFPAGFLITKRRRVWEEGEVDAWLEKRMAGG